MRPYNRTMTCASTFRFVRLCGIAFAASIALAPASHAQVAPVPYLSAAGSFGFGGTVDTDYFGNAPDEDGFRKGFSVSSYSTPISGLGGRSFFGSVGAPAFTLSGLTSEGAQYGYSFRGVGDMPMTLFGGVNAIRTAPDVFTSLVTPGFERTNTLATGFNAGIEFKPAPNVSLSLSGSFVQPSATTDTDLRSQLISSQQPSFRNWR